MLNPRAEVPSHLPQLKGLWQLKGSGERYSTAKAPSLLRWLTWWDRSEYDRAPRLHSGDCGGRKEKKNQFRLLQTVPLRLPEVLTTADGTPSVLLPSNTFFITFQIPWCHLLHTERHWTALTISSVVPLYDPSLDCRSVKHRAIWQIVPLKNPTMSFVRDAARSHTPQRNPHQIYEL